MAAMHSRDKVPVGSASWLSSEQNAADQFIDQLMEDFTYSARNELEWLNEHMEEVFNRTGFDVGEAFKTPGKLRGKTPRTARKRNASDHRAPLTDIFTSNLPLTAVSSQATKASKGAHFQVAEDGDENHVASQTAVRFSTGIGKENTDSGYHDMTDNESGIDQEERSTPQTYSASKIQTIVPPPLDSTTPHLLHHSQQSKGKEAIEASNSVGELAKHDMAPPSEIPLDDTEVIEDAVVNALLQKATIPDRPAARTSNQYSISAETAAAMDDALEEVERQSPVRQEGEFEAESSSSGASSPARPAVRKKSSLTFASLPAREPLTTKKSLGPSISRLSQMEFSKTHTATRESQYGKPTGGKALTEPQLPPAQQSDMSEDDYAEAIDVDEEGTQNVRGVIHEAKKVDEEVKMQSKTSTQRLQEKLAMLGKSNPARLSKSMTLAPSQPTIPDNAAGVQNKALNSSRQSFDDVNDDDWIGPITESQHSAIPRKAHVASYTTIEQIVTGQTAGPDGPGRSNMTNLQKEFQVAPYPHQTTATHDFKQITNKVPDFAYPKLDMHNTESTTPFGSPVHKKNIDGPLSASKAKLYSVLKSAKGIFASSAGASAQAKLETLPSQSSQVKNMTTSTSLIGTTPQVPFNQKPVQQASDVHSSEMLRSDRKNVEGEGQQSRRSSQRIEKLREAEAKRAKEKQQLDSDLELVMEKGRQKIPALQIEPKVAHSRDEFESVAPAPNMTSTVDTSGSEPANKPHSLTSQLPKPSELRRPLRPNKDAPKVRPAPVAIKLASQKIGQIAPANASLGMVLQESMSQPAPSRPTLSKKSSTASFTSSAQSFKTAPVSNSSRPRALEAAARKKEQDEREAQRKAEQKRELERRRAVKAEDDRRFAEEQKIAEQQKTLEAKNAARRQAAEQSRVEAIRRNEQARKDAANTRTRAEDDFAPISQVDQPQMQSASQKAETLLNRPVSRVPNTQDSARGAVPHINPAKPAKRQFNFNDDVTDGQPQQPNFTKSGLSSAQPASKRRRTSEDGRIDIPARPTMAPPIRPSNMHKDLSNKFAHGYLNNATSSHVAPSMLKTAVTTQHNLQHPKTPHMNDLAKFSSAKIPFSEAPNPPQGGPSQSKTHRPQPALKTPATAHKSSPQYPNGDSIDLPDIASNSDDSEDDENDFVPPDWANSPALRELLRQQQLVDPLQVFGPIAPLMMEEVFKGNKERQARFRARTSSANWNGTDRLTDSERRRDREARERLEKEGGWTYGGAV